MAGLFNFFTGYNKEGPGIDKNAPKKKTFFVFFETFFRNFWKFISINLVYNLISLPLITNGLASAGLTNVARNTARDKHSFGLSDFFETIKKNWKQSLAAGIINTIIYIILIIDAWFFYNVKDETVSLISLGIVFSILFVFTIMNYYVWTLIITFKYKLKTIYMNSFKFVFINLKNNLICFFTTVLILAINIGLAYLLLKYVYLVVLIELALYLTVYPAFKFLLVQYCVFPSIKKCIIDPYYHDHPNEDLELRRNLGLEIEEEKSQETEPQEENALEG